MIGRENGHYCVACDMDRQELEFAISRLGNSVEELRAIRPAYEQALAEKLGVERARSDYARKYLH